MFNFKILIALLYPEVFVESIALKSEVKFLNISKVLLIQFFTSKLTQSKAFFNEPTIAKLVIIFLNFWKSCQLFLFRQFLWEQRLGVLR